MKIPCTVLDYDKFKKETTEYDANIIAFLGLDQITHSGISAYAIVQVGNRLRRVSIYDIVIKDQNESTR